MELKENFVKECDCIYRGEHYKVRDNGAVLRLPLKGKKPRKLDNIWTFGTKSRTTGYMTIGRHRVHIIVATAFYGKKDSNIYVVDHIDTNRCNNRVENLRWLTKLENILLNPITKRKIEFLCGSIESFLENPSQLSEHSDKNFTWMRTVTKEEAAITLKNWQHLIETPRVLPTSDVIGDWIMSREIGAHEKFSSVFSFTKSEKPFTPIVPTNEELEEQKKKKIKEKAAAKRKEAKAIMLEETAERTRMQSVLERLSVLLDFELQTRYSIGDWKVDFFLSRSREKIAVQMFSPIIKEQEFYEACRAVGVTCYWFGHEFQQGLGEPMLPNFKIKEQSCEDFIVYITNTYFVSIRDFITAAFEDRIVIKKMLQIETIKVRFILNECYRCGYEYFIYIVSGLVSNFDTSLETLEGLNKANVDSFDEFNPIVIDSVRLFLNTHPELNYSMGTIKERYSHSVGKSYMSFGCPMCDGILGDSYLREMSMEYTYEKDDEFVHRVVLSTPIEIEYIHWEII